MLNNSVGIHMLSYDQHVCSNQQCSTVHLILKTIHAAGTRRRDPKFRTRHQSLSNQNIFRADSSRLWLKDQTGNINRHQNLIHTTFLLYLGLIDNDNKMIPKINLELESLVGIYDFPFQISWNTLNVFADSFIFYGPPLIQQEIRFLHLFQVPGACKTKIGSKM